MTRTGAVALAAAALAGPAAAAPAPPPDILPLVPHPRLVMSARLLGGDWQMWVGRDQVFVVRMDVAPRAITGGPCPPARRPLRVCIRGAIDRRLSVAIGRVTPRVAQLSGRTRSGALLPVARGRGWFLGVATLEDPGRVLVARDERGTVIARARVDRP